MTHAQNIRIRFTLAMMIVCNITMICQVFAFGNGWQNYNDNFYGGKVQAIVIDSKDPNRVYIGTLGGGFFYTENFSGEFPAWTRSNLGLRTWNILSLMEKDGFIYAGTTHGIYKLALSNLDGEWQEYKHDKIELANYVILKMRNCMGDPDAFYIIGHEQNVPQRKLIIIKNSLEDTLLDLKTNINDVAPYRPKDNPYNDILGAMYVGSDQGLYKFFNYLKSPDSSEQVIKDTVFCLAERRYRREMDETYPFAVYAGTPNGVKFFGEGKGPYVKIENKAINFIEPWLSVPVPPEEYDNTTKLYAIDSQNKIYQNGGLYEDWVEIGSFPSTIHSLAAHENRIENPLIGTTDGLYFLDNDSTWIEIREKNFYANRVHAIVYDATKNVNTSTNWNQLWAGTDGALFSRMPKSEWSKRSIYPHITDIEIDPGGEYLYLSSKGGGVLKIDKNSGEAVNFDSNELIEHNITVLALDNQSIPTIYAGAEDGSLFKWRGYWDKIIHVGGNISSIAIDPNFTQNTNILYFSSLNEVYRIETNSNYETPPTPWVSSDTVNTLVFNDALDTIFAGTGNGIFVHSVEGNITDNWLPFSRMALANKNVAKLQLIPTHPLFDGVLYAMVSDSVERFSQIFRNVIGYPDIIDSTDSQSYNDPRRQYGESFCVNLNNPDTIYVGTAGSGVHNYGFEPGTAPKIAVTPQDFGDVAYMSETTGRISFTNNNSFSPLIVSFDIDDDTNFILNSTGLHQIVHPGKERSFTFTFKPHQYDRIRASLNVYWRDIFLIPVQQDSAQFSLEGSGNGADFIIDDKADDTLNFTLKALVGPIGFTKILKWKKVGNVTLNNFSVIYPKDEHHWEWKPNDWANQFKYHDSGEVTIRFHHTMLETLLDTISISYNCGSVPQIPKMLCLQGIGLDGILTLVNGNTLDFGEIPENDHSLLTSVTIKNTGNIPIYFSDKKLSIRGSDSDNFEVVYPPVLPDTLKQNRYGDYINLRFSPDSVRGYASQLYIPFCDSGRANSTPDTTILTLMGTGSVNQIVALPKDSLRFGRIHMNSLADTNTLSITNVSTIYDVKVDTPYLTGSEKFSILNPQSFLFAKSNGSCYNFGTIDIEFDTLADQSVLVQLGPDTALINFVYNYWDEKNAIKTAVRTDTLNGFIIRSYWEGDTTAWNPQVNINHDAVTVYKFTNTGNINLHHQAIHKPKDPPYQTELNYGVPNLLPPGDALGISFIFNATDTLDHQDSLQIHFWDRDDFGTKGVDEIITLRLNGKGIDNITPQIKLLTKLDPVWNQPITIKAKIFDEHSGVQEDYNYVFYRQGGAMDFDSLKMDKLANEYKVFSKEIPGEKITEKGIEIFIQTMDYSGQKGYYPIRENRKFYYDSPPVAITESGITLLDENGGIKFLNGGANQQEYQLISIPLTLHPDSSAAAKIFGESLTINDYHDFYWRAAEYYYTSDGSKPQFIYADKFQVDKNFSNFVPGKPFFLLVGYRYPKKQLKRQIGYTITTSEMFTIELQKGWNLFANPFNFPVPVNNLSLSQGEGEIDVQAFTNGHWIELTDKDSLRPWEGNALYVDEEMNTLIINPNLNPVYQCFAPNKIEQKTTCEWNIGIEASGHKLLDLNNYAAVSKNALIGKDALDKPEPLLIGDYISLYFHGPAVEQSENHFAVDVQPPHPQGNIWNFSVSSNVPQSDLKMSFTNLSSVPPEFHVFLTCEYQQSIQDLRDKSVYLSQFSSNSNELKFKLLVGTMDFLQSHDQLIGAVPSKYRLSKNYPNPFSFATTICYEIPHNEIVTINIYNVLGELVKTIEKQPKLAGRHIIAWDGTNQANEKVKNGIYFFQFSAQHFSDTIKMILIR